MIIDIISRFFARFRHNYSYMCTYDISHNVIYTMEGFISMTKLYYSSEEFSSIDMNLGPSFLCGSG